MDLLAFVQWEKWPESDGPSFFSGNTESFFFCCTRRLKFSCKLMKLEKHPEWGNIRKMNMVCTRS